MIRALAVAETVIDIIIAMKLILYRMKRSIDDIKDLRSETLESDIDERKTGFGNILIQRNLRIDYKKYN